MFWRVVTCSLGGESLFSCRGGEEEGEIGEGRGGSVAW